MSTESTREPVAAQGRENPRGGAAATVVMRGLEHFGVPLLAVVMIVYFALDPSIGSVFTGDANVKNLLGNQAVTAIVALAMVVPLVAGYFDLSVSATMGVSNVAVAATMGTHHWPVAVAVLFGLLLGGLIGFINGFLVARVRLNGFVVTLGTYTLLLGLVQLYTKGQQIINGIPSSFSSWGAETWLGIPKPFYLLMVVATAVWYLLQQIPFGRYLEAIGSNESAARLVGIDNERVIWSSFVISGVLAAVAGALQTSRAGGADPAIATAFLFPALAAVFLGATMIKPGRYNVWGTVIGVFFVAVTVSGFTLQGADIWVQPVFNGAALILAVLLSTLMARSRERRMAVAEQASRSGGATQGPPHEPPAAPAEPVVAASGGAPDL
jgi:ribose transport system permease protein